MVDPMWPPARVIHAQIAIDFEVAGYMLRAAEWRPTTLSLRVAAAETARLSGRAG